MAKRTIDQLRGFLGSGNTFNKVFREGQGSVQVSTRVLIWRMDINPKDKKPPKFETYCLIIERGYPGFLLEPGQLSLDFRSVFTSFEEMIDFLQKNHPSILQEFVLYPGKALPEKIKEAKQ